MASSDLEQLRRCVFAESVYNALVRSGCEASPELLANHLRAWWVPGWGTPTEVVTVEAVTAALVWLAELGLLAFNGSRAVIEVRDRMGGCRPVQTNYEAAALVWPGGRS